MPQFSRNNDKLNSYYFDTLKIGKKNNLAEVTKVILTLSHGQADVERGFSTNKDTVKTNQKELSLVSRCLVKDSMKIKDFCPTACHAQNR